MWYGILTIFHMLFLFIFRKHYILILILLSILAFICQYNGMNFLYCRNCTTYVRRLLELFPFSVIGFIIASSGIMNYFKKYILQTIIVCIYLCYFLIFYDIFIEIKGYGVCGIRMFIFSICIFIIFAVFPSEKINNKIIILIIKQLTNHTAGVYFLHLPVYYNASYYIKTIGQLTIKGVMMNYIVCYCICFIGNCIFGRTILRHLFL